MLVADSYLLILFELAGNAGSCKQSDNGKRICCRFAVPSASIWPYIAGEYVPLAGARQNPLNTIL
jgi:hypothetical protein